MTLLVMRPGRTRDRQASDARRRTEQLHARLAQEIARPGWRDWLAGVGLVVILAEVVALAEVLR